MGTRAKDYLFRYCYIYVIYLMPLPSECSVRVRSEKANPQQALSEGLNKRMAEGDTESSIQVSWCLETERSPPSLLCVCVWSAETLCGSIALG